MRPFLACSRTVTRSASSCPFCRYPLAEFDPAYSLVVGGVVIYGPACSLRCIERDGREKRRGRIEVMEAAQ